jgi:hypothetical protein
MQRKHRNPERSHAAPPALQYRVPIPQPHLQGLLSQPPAVEGSQYQAIMHDAEELPDASYDYNAPSSSAHPIPSTHTTQILDAIPSVGSSSQAQSRKRKATNSLSGAPTRKRTCQKCGNANCSGASRRSLCPNACQDCGNKQCRGRNSQHPLKNCQEGWQLHHKNIKY